MTVKLYRTILCPRVRAVLMLAKAINLEFEHIEVDLQKKEHLKPEFLKINPLHTVPTIDDNGFIMWDSYALFPYLIAKYAKNDDLYPSNPEKRAVIDQRLYYNSGTVFPRFGRLVLAAKEGKPATEETVKPLYEALDILEKFLGQSKYIAGDSITVADISLAADLSAIQILTTLDKERFPKLIEWFKNIENQPFYEANKPGLEQSTAMFKELLAGTANKL